MRALTPAAGLRAPRSASERAHEAAVLRELVELARRDPQRGLLQFESLVGARQYAPLYRLARLVLPAGAHVLDWGAGNGHFSHFLLRSGHRVTAYSLGPDTFSAHLPPGGFRFVRGERAEPTRLPFAGGAFDAVASIGVLEHVHEYGGNDRRSLEELVRVLRPGGILLLYHLPNRWSWIESVAARVPAFHHHDVRYRRAAVVRLLNGAGLEPVLLRRYGMLPRNQWLRVPRAIGDSEAVAALWDGLDALLARVVPLLCQNHMAVARKPAR